jgi:inhibitor of cysteine peptidase
MKLKNIGFIFFTKLIILCSAIAYADSGIKQASLNQVDRVYTEQQPNISVDAAHRIFTIKLKSNRTTGYSWYLREYDPNLLLPEKHSFEAPKERLIGAPGYELWTFQVKPAGFVVPQQTTIRFIYARSWDTTDGATPLVFHVSTNGR